jgi:hypothetical protein
VLRFALTPFLAVNCFYLIFVHQFYFPNILSLKTELVIFAHYLKLVGKLVGANFVYIEQIHCLFIFAYMKIPNTIQLPSETMNRLICPGHRGCTLLMIKVLY